MYTQLLFSTSNRISLMHRLTDYLKFLTQNFCFQTANWRSIQPSRIASYLSVTADTNHGKPEESSILQLLIPLNRTLLTSNSLHRQSVILCPTDVPTVSSDHVCINQDAHEAHSLPLDTYNWFTNSLLSKIYNRGFRFSRLWRWVTG